MFHLLPLLVYRNLLPLDFFTVFGFATGVRTDPSGYSEWQPLSAIWSWCDSNICPSDSMKHLCCSNALGRRRFLPRVASRLTGKGLLLFLQDMAWAPWRCHVYSCVFDQCHRDLPLLVESRRHLSADVQHTFWVVLLLNLVVLLSLFASFDIVVHDSVHIESGLDVWWALVVVVAFWCTVLEIELCDSDPVFRQSSGSIFLNFGDPNCKQSPVPPFPRLQRQEQQGEVFHSVDHERKPVALRSSAPDVESPFFSIWSCRFMFTDQVSLAGCCLRRSRLPLHHFQN